MFTIDTTSNERFYIILKDGKEFVRMSKANDFEAVKKQVEMWGAE